MLYILYLGEELDAVANPDEVHLVVEPEDVHRGPRVVGVKDHGVTPQQPSRCHYYSRALYGWLVSVGPNRFYKSRICRTGS